MKQAGHMWGCLIVKIGGTKKEWRRLKVKSRTGDACYVIIFTKTRREIMPLVRYMRSCLWIKSAKAVKVPIPEGP